MDGIILINKEKGYTSHDVVNKVKHVFNEKVGHTGTLDPNATGLLPILVGKGTKLSQFLINHDKEYEVTLKLGKKVIAVPRYHEYAEHVNNHQIEIVDTFNEKGYIIGVKQVSELEEALIKIEKFEPKKYELNNKKMLNIIENFIDKV